MLTKLLASAVLRKLVKVAVIALLKALATRSENKIDDEIIKAIEEALA